MKNVVLILISAFLLHSCPPMPETGSFIKEEFAKGTDKALAYNVLYPIGYDHSKKAKYPLILFLHGAGERGMDNQLQLKHLSDKFSAITFQEKHQAIVVFPQCPKEDYWVNQKDFQVNSKGAPTTSMNKVIHLMDLMIKQRSIDKRKVYVAGLSMGGMGTLDLLSRKPDWFAAAVSICGAGDKDVINAYKDIPLVLCHGKKDEVVPYEKSLEIYEALQKTSNKSILKTYPEAGHLVWDLAFEGDDLLNWLMSHKK